MKVLGQRGYGELLAKVRTLRAERDLSSPYDHYRAPFAGGCTNAGEVSFSRSRSVSGGVITIAVPCRRCSWCARKRRAEWAKRASVEHERVGKSWLGTLTWRPGTDVRPAAFDDIQTEEVKGAIAPAGQEFTRYVKRLRKSGVGVRYCAALELHKDGTPHFHFLMHTTATWRQLARPWNAGFARFNLVTSKGGLFYVAKYLHKLPVGVRVRASKSYGASDTVSDHTASRCEAPRAGDDVSLKQTSIEWVREVIDMVCEHVHGQKASEEMLDELSERLACTESR